MIKILGSLCTPMFIAAQFTIAKYWKQPKCPSANEWIQKLWYIYTMEFYSAERKKEVIPFATAWMKLESIMLSAQKFLISLILMPFSASAIFCFTSSTHAKCFPLRTFFTWGNKQTKKPSCLGRDWVNREGVVWRSCHF